MTTLNPSPVVASETRVGIDIFWLVATHRVFAGRQRTAEANILDAHFSLPRSLSIQMVEQICTINLTTYMPTRVILTQIVKHSSRQRKSFYIIITIPCFIYAVQMW